MNNNQLEELKLNIKNELKSVIEAELLTELDDRLKLQNNEIDNELIRVRQALQSDGEELKDDQVGNILNEHMKDITKETRPQMSASGGLEGSKKHFRDSRYHNMINFHQGLAIDTLESFKINSFDFAFIDADKINYKNYYLRCVHLI